MIHLKLKGGALYIAIVVSLLIAIILSLFIVLAYYNSQSISNNASLFQLKQTVYSGLELSNSDYFQNNYSWKKMPYNNDSIKIVKKNWGSYQLIQIQAKNKHHRINKTGLFGVAATPDTALITQQNSKQVGIAGTVKFNSFCYLPNKGLKTVYIGGSGSSDFNVLRAFIKQAPEFLTPLDKNYLESIKITQNSLDIYTDSLIPLLSNNLVNSFNQKTCVFEQPTISLNTHTLSGNIKIIAGDIISVDSTCKLDQVFLIARKIVFKDGFNGIVNALATDSIVAGNRCVFGYPSSFTVYNSLNSSINYKVCGIFFGEFAKFYGALICETNNTDKIKSFIRFNKNFELIGNAYSSDYIDIQGNLYGTIQCQSLLVQTSSSTFENCIMDCNLNSRKFGNIIAVPNWFNKKGLKYKCTKWL